MNVLTCPNCQTQMQQRKEPDLSVESCPKCGSVFLDKGELNAFATGMAGDIEYCSIDQKEHTDHFPLRVCPKCPKTTMRKIALLSASHLIFDFCPQCEGFFLDQGEIEAMNIELAKFTKDKAQGEYRGYLEGRLVVVDKLEEVMIAQNLGGLYTTAESTTSIRISVYLKKPLEVGLRLYSEKWTDKLLKIFHLFRKQDIQTGFKELDQSFIIQGTEEKKVCELLSCPVLQKDLLRFSQERPKIYKRPGTLEIWDNRLVYLEGPYLDEVQYDIEKDPAKILERMQILAGLFEREQGPF